MADSEHPRLVLHNFLSPDLCKELGFIHKSCCTIGYRPNVFSTTLSHLIATNSAHLIMPFIPIRERLKEEVEGFFGCEYELFIEFTGLISWSKGANIGWHSDDNRPYLKQRDFAAVCYLNSCGIDFRGGHFHFLDGEPATFIPETGDVLIYTADGRNIHSVEEVTDGERLTLTLWFSRDKSHDEDINLISFLKSSSLTCLDTHLPSPASSNMYWFPPEQVSSYQSGFDIRFARIHALGYDLFSSADTDFVSTVDSSCNISDAPTKPLSLARRHELFGKEFSNIMHALQVVQFYHWKAPELQLSEIKTENVNTMQICRSQQEKVHNLKLVLLKDQHLAEAIFTKSAQNFDWVTFSVSDDLWEAYSNDLRYKLIRSLPCWIKHQSIFHIPLVDLKEEA